MAVSKRIEELGRQILGGGPSLSELDALSRHLAELPYSLIRAEMLKAQYDAARASCPSCGSSDIVQTAFGVTLDVAHPEAFRDTNSASCGGCNWKGIVDDLKPEVLPK
jgi:hypothetical protein